MVTATIEVEKNMRSSLESVNHARHGTVPLSVWVDIFICFIGSAFGRVRVTYADAYPDARARYPSTVLIVCTLQCALAVVAQSLPGTVADKCCQPRLVFMIACLLFRGCEQMVYPQVLHCKFASANNTDIAPKATTRPQADEFKDKGSSATSDAVVS
eukprot:jgi/Psemu1/285991/fgenesh1_pg.112_\